ncbi:uncharacterized protein IL334_000048 [Kwoniella shivajii]|uniref:Dolichol-phosphate mannosyltransferase n=1 Tax=Kwoniella shivajii TaxID=564305 RepID=A0ABZ1CN16_9TREE|nr:hypothetical protein IL334_000048 [Kwoniella shivajii]
MSLSGILSTLDLGLYKYPTFTSGDLSSKKAVVFIGGLTNGLGAVPFSYPLSESLGKVGWQLVQFHWSSAYGGYGTGSLDRDRKEMEALVKHLRGTGIRTIVIAGHSTGSQNIMHYVSNPIFQTPTAETDVIKVDGGIMQAPVSDREFMKSFKMKEWFDVLPLAEQMIKDGKGEELMPKEFCDKAGFDGVSLPINACRLRSLIGTGGDDEYFSDDIPAEPESTYAHSLSDSFGSLSAPTLALYAEEDIKYQEGDVIEKIKRWEEASKGKLQWRLLKNASHDVAQPEAQKYLCEEVIGWLKQFD